MAEQQNKRTVGPVTLASAGGGSVVGVSVAQLISGLIERGGGEPLSDGLVYAITILATAAFAILGGWLMPSQREALHAQAAEAGRALSEEEYLSLVDDAAKVVLSAKIPVAPVAADAQQIDHDGRPVVTDEPEEEPDYVPAHAGEASEEASDPGPRP